MLPLLKKKKEKTGEKASERRREAWRMAMATFLKMKCEIVPENSYRIIHSLSLPLCNRKSYI